VPQLTAALIVRDAAGHLASCLESISGFVDEIVIVDTGSVDNSRDIARDFGARLFERRWTGDFAAARNAALDEARSEWILYIDADERLVVDDPAAAKTLLADSGVAGCLVNLRAREGYRPYREMRLFRRHPLIRFEGTMHETIWPGIARYREDVGGRIEQSPLALEHEGYEGPVDAKHKRDIPLLEHKLTQDPDHVYSWWHLGRIKHEKGLTAEARETWSKGVDAARRRGFRYWADSLVYAALIQLEFDDRDTSDALLGEAMGRYPDHAYLVWIEGQKLIRDGRYAEALPRFQMLVDWDSRNHESDGYLGYPEQLFQSMAFEGLASCHFKLRQFTESAAWFDQAAKAEPGRLELRIKRDLAERLASGK
jgi:glycosyltransferase involved in cell wall biosynthesis